jgi:hypothetical protein
MAAASRTPGRLASRISTAFAEIFLLSSMELHQVSFDSYMSLD